MRATLWLWSSTAAVLCITASEQGSLYRCQDITDCNWNQLCPIKRLDCSNKSFGHLTTVSLYPEESLRQLTELWMNNSGITSLGYLVFYNMNSLKFLTLRGNFLDSLDSRIFYSLIDLEYLDLSQNELNSINNVALFASQANLRRLLLGFNKLTTLTNMIFLHMIKLNYLELSNNYLYYISDSLFSSQEHLSTLLLNGNKLTTINVTLLRPLRSIERLELSENPLQYDCNLRLTVLWCKDMKLHIGNIFHNPISEQVYKWTTLEYFENCSANNVHDTIILAGGNNSTNSEYISVSISSLYLVVLGILTFTVLQIMCSGYLYFKMRQRFSISPGQDEIMLCDRSSKNIHHYDYITSTSTSELPELPARPIQTRCCENSEILPLGASPKPEKTDHAQSAALCTRVDLIEPYLCIRNDLYAECLRNVEPDVTESRHAHDEIAENYRRGEKEIKNKQ